MHFLPDVFIPCDVWKELDIIENSEIKFKEKNIDVLDMTVEEGCEFFGNIQTIRSNHYFKACWSRLYENRSCHTLSGGEAQRMS